jgi:molecular chaperone IbpA
MAVAGFSLVSSTRPSRRIRSASRQVAEGRREKNVNGYLHRGIARPPFERRFSLTDHMKVTGAHLDNGMPSGGG